MKALIAREQKGQKKIFGSLRLVKRGMHMTTKCLSGFELYQDIICGRYTPNWFSCKVFWIDKYNLLILKLKCALSTSCDTVIGLLNFVLFLCFCCLHLAENRSAKLRLVVQLSNCAQRKHSDFARRMLACEDLIAYNHGRRGVSNEISQISTPDSSVTTQPMLIKLETCNYCRKTTHHVKRYFNRTTWVVWAIASLPL